MLSSMDISTSGMVAQRVRLNAISSNLANMSTTHNELGERVPYQPRYAVFQADTAMENKYGGVGVRVAEIETSQVEPLMKYEPGHPDANAQGYVAYPNIDMTTEFVDALEATRAYEANVGVLEISKNLSDQTLRILA